MIRLLTRLAGIVIAAALLFAMQRTTPGYSEITGPIPVSGAMGQSIAARGFSFRADKLILADRIRWRAYGRDIERDSSGLWAVVVAEMEGRPASVTANGALWRSASGRRYTPSQRLATAPRQLGANRLEPGLPQRGLLIFEIPREEADDATLLVSLIRWPRLDSEIRMPLARDRTESTDVLDLDGLFDG
ncbi:hypothetical protein [Bosea sp. BK604]|uniref:hypothetical protein n=1 Tax=Bosea sp. BK604 TaxID=2512180 RepID=UPI00104D0587|nr:hypothetical protein [Bosea sp. BK604]TCR67589.1 hypothetical protein EV560_103653 [Bosea sp. BK604]